MCIRDRENAKCIPHTYQVGDPVMIQNYQHRKYGQPRYSGPYDIDRVNDNGAVHLRQTTANGGAVYRTWNIRNIFPFKAWSPLSLNLPGSSPPSWLNVLLGLIPPQCDLHARHLMRHLCPLSWGRMHYMAYMVIFSIFKLYIIWLIIFFSGFHPGHEYAFTRE